jgi:P27 family predicted phage terminase small subunit
MSLPLSIDELKVRGHSDTAIRRNFQNRRAETRDVDAGCPTRPSYLSRDERKVFAATIRLLAARGTLTAGDGPAVALYAQTVVEHRAERQQLEREGRVVITERLDTHNQRVVLHAVNPRVRVVRDLEKQLTLLLRELGLTPLRRHQVRKAKTPLSLDDLVKLPGGIS